MSATTQTVEKSAQINEETPTSDVRYSFKVTQENKTERALVSLSKFHRRTMQNRVVQNGRWRSDAQFMVDAIVHYLDGENESVTSPEEVVKVTQWGDTTLTFAITETLFNEVDMMVNHPHTPWNTKQEFYICAIQNFTANDYPVVDQR